MEKFVFHVIGRTHGMIEVDSSSLRVSECTVLSEGSLSPFGISGGGGCSGSSISILSSKYSGSNERVMSLPPLISLTLPSKHEPTHQDISTNTFDTSMNAVHGSGVCLSSTDLGFGTGPLFDFGVLNSLSAAVPQTTISLTHSSLRNVSSVAPKTTRQLFAQTRQILESCVVEDSTNHFSGTATADVNMCGSFLASNSSFSKCSSNLAPSHSHPTYTLSHRTGADVITVATGTQIEEVKITRCSFKSMTSSTTASSVHFVTSVGNTEIAECSFFDCYGTSSLGGTVFVKLDRSIAYSAKCSSCVFVRCRGQPTNGAALEFDRAMPYTVSDCVFYQTESTDKGAALILSNTQHCQSLSTVFNSIFESSFSGNVYSGAALYMSLCDNFLFSSLRFVDTHADTPREIVHSHFSLKFSATNLQNCQSSRSSLTCGILWIYSGTPTSQEGLISPITKETFVKAFSGKASQAGKATFEIEVGDAVTGEMVVVVENLESTRSSSPPTIPRSLTFSFPTSAKTASCTVDVGDTELIQSPATEYQLRRAAVTDWLVHTLRVKSRTVSFTDQTKTQIVLSLDCDGLVRDGYSILVKTGSTERNISLTLQSDQKTYTATGSISTNAESVFMYATDYEIVAVKDEWGRALIVPSAANTRSQTSANTTLPSATTITQTEDGISAERVVTSDSIHGHSSLTSLSLLDVCWVRTGFIHSPQFGIVRIVWKDDE
ncbi:hypothetical protein BLNAU_15729 [Blattamonas nauphoetae]|uniref:Uncharacterized protein n=1 Tax=Blattamonas nauphoetae TaxID=2049346 RepID=A0ABQ9XD83_9EUKA|nr:hypothetical protein BLNAU_15729 [Blattamonas nauphoetae]